MFSKKSWSDAKDEHFKDTYILAMVHKLRTPLNAARWALDSVIGIETSDENKKILNEGYNKIISAINTVNEILKVSEIDSKNGINLRKERVNICVIVSDIFDCLDFLIKKNEITLEYDNKCNPITIYVDKEMLDMALTNIFDNAFRYSPKGKVSVNISKDGDIAKIAIKDNGIGIGKEDMKHIFEKFYRGKNAKEVDPNENGIGLYATNKIITMHNGSILIDSELNKGTTVEVRLPID
jgi:two-component system sensor histidine kinase VicK